MLVWNRHMPCRCFSCEEDVVVHVFWKVLTPPLPTASASVAHRLATRSKTASSSKSLPSTCAHRTSIREVRSGREKRATAAFFDGPVPKMWSILAWAETNYDVAFDNDQWRLERVKVDAGKKERPPLSTHGARQSASARQSE